MKSVWTALLMMTMVIVENVPLAAESHNGKVVKIDPAESRITIAAVMGHKSLRVIKPELLSQIKVGDQIKFTMGQDGAEAVVTGIEVNKQ